MNILQARMDDRDARHEAERAADERWLQVCGGIDPGERLERWDGWLKGVLARALILPEDGVRRERLLAKCAGEITGMVRQLRGRGWLLDGEALAAHVRACVAPVGRAQRAGKVRELFPYLARAVRDYVGQHAEEIQAQARRTGADEAAQSMGAVLAGLGLGGAAGAGTEGESLTELVARREGERREAKSLRESQAEVRRAVKNRRHEDTLPLL